MKKTALLCLVLLISLFAVAFIPNVAKAVEPTKYEYYDETPTGSNDVYGSLNWKGQTFTVGTVGDNVAFNVTNVRLFLYRVGLPGNLNVSIRATSGGLPTGNDIAGGIINANTLTISTAGAWVWINFTVWHNALQPATQYALVARAPSGNVANQVKWKFAFPGSYVGGTGVFSLDGDITWFISVAEQNFEVWGHRVWGYTFKGVLNEETGLMKSASQRAVNVTAFYPDGPSVTFEVNGTYNYYPSEQPLYFRYDLQTSTDTISQYGLNQIVYNTSVYIDIWFPQYEVNTAYTVTATLSWNSTYTITLKTTSGCRINFATAPTTDKYLNWYVHRTVLGTTHSRQYWLSQIENYGDTFYIFDSELQTYTVSFLDLGGVLKETPFISAQRFINGSYLTVEKLKVDVENKVDFQLVEGQKYNLFVSDTVVSHVFGDFLTTSIHTITLTLRGIDFPKETILIYKYVRIYGLRSFSNPVGTISITYQDTLNMTFSVIIYIKYANGSTAYTTTETDQTFILTWASADNHTDYQVTATIAHARFGTYNWKQYFPREYSSNPWVLGWLGSLSINVNYLVGIFIIVAVGAGFSMINPEVGAFLATCVAAALTIMGWIPVPPGLLIAAFCFSLMFAIIIARRRVTYAY